MIAKTQKPTWDTFFSRTLHSTSDFVPLHAQLEQSTTAARTTQGLATSGIHTCSSKMVLLRDNSVRCKYLSPLLVMCDQAKDIADTPQAGT